MGSELEMSMGRAGPGRGQIGMGRAGPRAEVFGNGPGPGGPMLHFESFPSQPQNFNFLKNSGLRPDSTLYSKFYV